MKEIESGSRRGKVPGNTPEENFKGYSMEELRYQRALISLRKEFCRSKTLNSVNNLRNPLSGRKNNASGWIGKAAGVVGVAGKLLSRMNIIDYAMVGMTLFEQGRKVYKLIKGKK